MDGGDKDGSGVSTKITLAFSPVFSIHSVVLLYFHNSIKLVSSP